MHIIESEPEVDESNYETESDFEEYDVSMDLCRKVKKYQRKL